MSTIVDIIRKLEAIDPPVFRMVGGAAEFATVNAAPKTTPAAFVLTLQETAGENERDTGPVMQRVEADIGVIIVTSNLSDARGDATARDIEALKRLVRANLIGFVPSDSDGMPLEHVSGELLKSAVGHIWWQEIYAATSFIEEQPEATGGP